ncbi:calcium ion binding protein [Aureococcus anophagefferens]|nr:calcium ion binding protein [Aureococcus anophagefferens]
MAAKVASGAWDADQAAHAAGAAATDRRRPRRPRARPRTARAAAAASRRATASATSSPGRPSRTPPSRFVTMSPRDADDGRADGHADDGRAVARADALVPAPRGRRRSTALLRGRLPPRPHRRAFLLGCLTAGAAVHALSRRAPAAAPDAKKQVELPTFGTTASAAARKFSTEQTDTASNPMRRPPRAVAEEAPRGAAPRVEEGLARAPEEERRAAQAAAQDEPFTVARAPSSRRGEASHWVECSDLSSGQVYYSNTKTGETTWTKPSGYHGPEAIAPGGKAKWLEAHDPKSGLPFYTNAATGETTWDRPKGVEIKPAPAKGARTRTLSADTKKFADI